MEVIAATTLLHKPIQCMHTTFRMARTHSLLLAGLCLPLLSALGAVPLALGLGDKPHALEMEPLDSTLRKQSEVRGQRANPKKPSVIFGS